MSLKEVEQEATVGYERPIPRIAFVILALFAVATVTFVLLQTVIGVGTREFAILCCVLMFIGFVFGSLYAWAFSPENNRHGSDLD